METYSRVCIADHVVEDREGKKAKVERGKEYITSKVQNGVVTVFSTYWFDVPVSVFGGEIRFT